MAAPKKPAAAAKPVAKKTVAAKKPAAKKPVESSKFPPGNPKGIKGGSGPNGYLTAAEVKKNAEVNKETVRRLRESGAVKWPKNG